VASAFSGFSNSDFLWGYLNENIYKNNIHSLDELKTSKTIWNVSTVTVLKVANNTRKRIDACIFEHGGHVQHLL
jgi:hypothetical protein